MLSASEGLLRMEMDLQKKADMKSRTKSSTRMNDIVTCVTENIQVVLVCVTRSQDTRYATSIQFACESCLNGRMSLNHCCPECPKTDKLSNLTSHFEKKHIVKDPEVCRFCKESFAPNKYWEHIVDAHYMRVDRRSGRETFRELNPDPLDYTSHDGPGRQTFEFTPQLNSFFQGGV